MLGSWQSWLIACILLSGTCHMKPTQSSGPGGTFDSGMSVLPEGKTESTTSNPNSKERMFPSQTDFPRMPGGPKNDGMDWLREYFRKTKMFRDRERARLSAVSKSTTLAPMTNGAIHETDSFPTMTSLGRGLTNNPPWKDLNDYDWSNDYPTRPPWSRSDVFNPNKQPDINWDDSMFRTVAPVVPYPTNDWEEIRRLQEMTQRIKDMHKFKWPNMEVPKWLHDQNSKESDSADDDSQSDEVEDADIHISPLWWALPVGGVIGLTCLVSLLSLTCRHRSHQARGNRLPHPLRAPGTLNATNRSNRRGPSLFITVRSSESRQNLFSTTDPNPSPQSEVLIAGQPPSGDGQNFSAPPAYGVCVDEAPPSYNDAVVNQTTDTTNANDIEINTFLPRPPSYSTVMTTGGAPPTYGEICGEAPPTEEIIREVTETADS
ncbi:uncharacterized protein LOC135501774 [Lineus longissimus]|uniref:uncharacterized protein LOC135501774 n=1 Tax=Lineus longissimus TaxID=88925 RepID=UPI002B4D592A